jgi:hypothetical protein
MGFDPLKLKMYLQLLGDTAFDFGPRNLTDIEIRSSNPAWANCLQDDSSPLLGFTPHPGWVGHIEIQPRQKVHGSELSTAA